MQTEDTLNKTGNTFMKIGRYKGSVREKVDRLAFQKIVLSCMQLARKFLFTATESEKEKIQKILQEMHNEYIKEKLAIERDY